ncbi:hypothetical protein AvCA_37310 [Azotobacter vinelandii CA]|uniref:IrrE N-terminal-like domain-containing protein n=3 Tax=Azotobacter group TaxID=351 RepID=C1DS01_AZOVD|nr:conserved hypothetical protein [Azotobacter vinelandii DJ]AGK16177.1 hypothetical protein AvCA_37310 [Azotobacter vinelandii CA]AGK21572.1 hypothetical protein AvCA6_37310 [Azotobacter vinelandii CA6]SFX44251.1 protein of unknown function [Azotobacter vinelandii]
MANRVLAIRGLRPPFDLELLAAHYGELEFLDIPFGVDGITVGIGGKSKPKILINDSISVTRKKFTLAHEIGHIVIPWHTGTIVSHIDSGEVSSAYLQMEAEANRFAAELLMPTSWLVDMFQKSETVEAYFRSVLDTVGASKEATFYKLFKPLPSPVVCVHVDHDWNLLSCQRSFSAPYRSLQNGPITREVFGNDNKFETFVIDDNIYLSWIFIGREIQEVDQRPWREVYTEILGSTGMEHSLQRINGVLAAAYNKSRGSSESEICGAILRAFASHDDLGSVLNHPLFEQYVIKRVKDMKQRS